MNEEHNKNYLSLKTIEFYIEENHKKTILDIQKTVFPMSI